MSPVPRRILIFGVTGSGKTTLARRLSEVTGIEWHDVDNLTWLPNWVQKDDAEQAAIFREIAAGDEWILDTAYGKWVDVVIPRVEMIVGLDYPRWFSLQRLVRRTVMRLFDRRPICNGNRESLRMMFSKESIIAWHFHAFARKRSQVRGWEANPGDKKVVVLRSAKETEAWLRSLAP